VSLKAKLEGDSEGEVRRPHRLNHTWTGWVLVRLGARCCRLAGFGCQCRRVSCTDVDLNPDLWPEGARRSSDGLFMESL